MHFFYQPNGDVLLLQPFSRLAVFRLVIGSPRFVIATLTLKGDPGLDRGNADRKLPIANNRYYD
jgi:hypothetical protein